MSTPAASPSSMSRYLVGGAIALLLAAGFAIVIFAIVASSWGVALSVAVWLAVTVWAVRNWTTYRFAMLIAVAAMAVFWTVFLLIGDGFFDFGA